MHFQQLPLLLLTLLPPLTTATPTPQLLPPSLLSSLLNLLPILSSPPPPLLLTKTPSPECATVNGGALYYCQSIINGDIPLVVTLADGLGYTLNKNSVNCLYPSKTPSSSQACSAIKQCCQVDVLASTPISGLLSLAVYCQAPPS